MNRRTSSIVYVLTHHTTVGIIVGLVLLFVLSNQAQGDWLTMEKNGVTVAILHNEIVEADLEIPEVDRYVINSQGGLFHVAHQIAESIKGQDKPIFFNTAYSAAAYIVCKTGGKPIGDNATLGFHWARTLPGEIENKEFTEYINTIMLQAMLDIVPVVTASKIIGQMHTIYHKDQTNSMILFNVETNKITTITEGKTQ
jgi:hypothetical protein